VKGEIREQQAGIAKKLKNLKQETVLKVWNMIYRHQSEIRDRRSPSKPQIQNENHKHYKLVQPVEAISTPVDF
jgi:hypothetical protein